MKILLINPPFIFDKKSNIILSHCLGILQIAAVLRDKGHNVSVLDALQRGFNRYKKYGGSYRVGLSNKDIIKSIPPDTQLIGLSIPFSHLASLAHKLINDIKETYPEIPIVMGGIYPSTQPEKACRSKADYIVLGEGEEPMLNLASFLNGDTSSMHKGIIDSCNAGSAKASYGKNINAYPLPARDIIPFSDYTKRSPRNVRGWRSASMITSRGCPFDCEFCAVHPVCGYRWRPYTVDRVLAEIHDLVDRYSVNNIEIEDDNFTLNKQRVKGILHGIIDINKTKRLTWQALNGLRIDTLDQELISLFRESNCRHLNIALEHGDPEMLKIMNKRLDLDKVVDVVKNLKKYNISSHVFTIYGYPGETKERFNNAVKFYSKIKSIAPNIVFKFFIAQPYPGTKLFKRCVEEGYLSKGIYDNIDNKDTFSTENKIWIETEDFNKKDVLRRKKILHKSLYNTKEYIMQKAREKLPDIVVSMLYTIYHKLGKIKKQ